MYGNGRLWLEINKHKENQFVVLESHDPNIIFFPSPHWGLRAFIGELGYDYEKHIESWYKDHTFYIDYGGFSLGLNYFFRQSRIIEVL